MVELTEHAQSIVESGLFLSPDHRQRFRQLAGMLSAGGGSVLLTSQSAALAEHYGLMLREVLLGEAGTVVENYLPGSSTALLTRFNAIVASLTVAQARGLDTQAAAMPPVRIFLVHDPETFEADEAGLLARLLADFPGARVCLLLLDSGGGEVVPRLQRLFRRQLQVWSIDAPEEEVLAASRVAAAEAEGVTAFDVLLDRAGLFTSADETGKESPQTDVAGDLQILPGQSEATDALGLAFPALPGPPPGSAELWTQEVDEASRWRLAPKTSLKARRPLLWGLGAALLMLALASLPLGRTWMQAVAERPAQVSGTPAESDPSSTPQTAVPTPAALPLHGSERRIQRVASRSDVFYLPEPAPAEPAAPAGDAVPLVWRNADDDKAGSPPETVMATEVATGLPVTEADLALRLEQGKEALLAAADSSWFVQKHRFTEAANAMGWILSVDPALAAGAPHLVPVQAQDEGGQWLAVIGPFEDAGMAERFVQDHGAEADYWIRSRQSLLELLQQSLEDG